MSNTTISPNMNLPVPVVSVDPGPDWASNINASLGIIDSHNHSPGQGVPVTPNGMNINTDLSFSGNNLTTARSVRFNPQAAVLTGTADLGCLYEVSADLYYNDGSGNNIRITQSGSVVGSAGTITGLPSGTASAAYSAGTFIFERATSTPAAISVGSTTIAQNIASGFGVTINASASQPSDYSITLPTALPATVQSTMVSDNLGNMTFLPLLGGTYTPTVISGGRGTAQAAVGPFFYQRVGNAVSVAGTLTGDVDNTAQCFWQVSLPFNPSSPFSQTYDLAGTVSVGIPGTVQAKTSSNNALVSFNLTGSPSGTSFTVQVTFMYSCA